MQNKIEQKDVREAGKTSEWLQTQISALSWTQGIIWSSNRAF